MRRHVHRDDSLGRLGSAAILVALLIFVLCAVTFGAEPSNLIRRSSAAASTSQPAPGGASASSLSLWRVAMALAIVLGMIFLMRWLAKKFLLPAGGAPGSRAIALLARKAISSKQHILVLQVGRRLIVVGDSGQQMNTLCEVSDPEEAAELLALINGGAKSFNAPPRAIERFKAPAPPIPPDDHDPSTPDESPGALASTRDELNGLMQKVRVLQRQFNRA